MRTLFLILVITQVSFSQDVTTPNGLESYFNTMDQNINLFVDATPKSDVTFKYSMDCPENNDIEMLQIQSVWEEFIRVAELNGVGSSQIDDFIPFDYFTKSATYAFSPYGLAQGYFDLKKTNKFVPTLFSPGYDRSQGVLMFGFSLYKNGWYYNIYVMDNEVAFTITTNDEAYVKQFVSSPSTQRYATSGTFNLK